MAGSISNAAVASARPISTPPTSAPDKLPSPPTMTTTKAISVKSTARNGWVSKIGAIRPPAAPAHAAPMPAVTAKIRGMRRPMTSPPSRLSAAARTAWPNGDKPQKDDERGDERRRGECRFDTRAIEVERSDFDHVEGERRRGRAGIRPEDHQVERGDDERHADEDDELHVLGPRHEALDEPALQSEAENEHDGCSKDRGRQRRQPKDAGAEVADIHAGDDHLAMREIDDTHDAEHDRQPACNERVVDTRQHAAGKHVQPELQHRVQRLLSGVNG